MKLIDAKNNQFTVENLVFIVLTYNETTSPRTTLALFCKGLELTQGIKEIYQPKKTIYKLVNDFKVHGSIENKNKKEILLQHITPFKLCEHLNVSITINSDN